MSRPLAVAITGGIGAGKTEALAAFRRHGAATVSSDEIVHELLRHNDVKRAVVERLGNGVVGPDGELDRGAIGTVVFNDRKALQALESVLHPLVSAEYLRWREQLARLPTPPRVCVTEVPLLYEAGTDAHFDKVVVITAPRKLRQARSASALDEREQRLLDDKEKIARADYSYVNTGSLDDLDAFVASVMGNLELVRRGRLVAAVLVLAVLGAAVYVVEASPPWFERLRYPLDYSAVVRDQARAERIDPALLAAVIYQESRFHPGARSKSGAVGLMQLRPSTAKGIALRTGGTAFHVSDLTNPAINIRYGAWYLGNLLRKYRQERLALAAYNAGQGNVDRWLDAGSPIQFPETRAYVSRVEHLKHVYFDAWHSTLYQS